MVHKVKSIGSDEVPDIIDTWSYRSGYLQGLMDAAQLLFRRDVKNATTDRVTDALDILKLRANTQASHDDTRH